MGIVLGGLAPLTLIPLLEKYIVKVNITVVGDHEDVKKDLQKSTNTNNYTILFSFAFCF